MGALKAWAGAFWLAATLWAGGARAAEGDACRQVRFEGDAFTVCSYAPSTDEIRLAWRDRAGPIGSLPGLAASLGKAVGRVRFAMNAGMYDPSRRPVGLYVAGSEALRPLNLAEGTGNFFLKPNGVFWVDGDGNAHIDESRAFAAGGAEPAWATQSGPLLVSGGALHPRVTPNGPSLAVRNAVGVRPDGGAEFVISAGPVSFGRLARFLRDDLGCAEALYLDGAVSSLWAPELGRMDKRTGLGTFVVVLRKAE